MIDLHCHFLPGVDDGPETMVEALDLARMAVADGITHSVLTSHLHPEAFPNRRSNLVVTFENFSRELQAAGIPLNVRLGGEARLCPELIELIAEDQVPFLGVVDGWRILLLEFPHQMIPVASLRFVYSLLKQKIRPLIAHPERNKAVMDKPERIREFTDAGCWLQLTGGSLVGRFGPQAQAVALALIESEFECVAATDAHNLQSRPPLLREAYGVIGNRFGADVADAMIVGRPGSIIGITVA